MDQSPAVLSLLSQRATQGQNQVRQLQQANRDGGGHKPQSGDCAGHALVSEGFQLKLSYPSSLRGLTPVPEAFPPPQSCIKTAPEPNFLCRQVSGVQNVPEASRMASQFPGTAGGGGGVAMGARTHSWNVRHQPRFFPGLISSRRKAANVWEWITGKPQVR